MCETVRRRLKTQQPWSPWLENLKGAGRKGLCTDGGTWTFGGSGFYSEELVQPCVKFACDLWKGSNLLPERTHKICNIRGRERKDWEAVGKEAAKAFLFMFFWSWRFLLFPLALLLFPQGCPLASLSRGCDVLGLNVRLTCRRWTTVYWDSNESSNGMSKAHCRMKVTQCIMIKTGSG